MATIHLPESNQDQTLKRFFLFSLALHAFLIVFLVVKSMFFPSNPKEYIPSLRVDLIGLPDLKISETKVLPPTPKAPEEVSKTEESKKEVKVDTKAENDGDYSLKKKKKNSKPTQKELAAQQKLKNALARIKALERIKALQNAEIKGNAISKGSALSGDAKTSLETTYHDVILERIRSNWELPKWLQEQENLKAKVAIFIDRRGQLARFEFRKSSGNEQFDAEVKRTLELSSPFPVPPEGIVSEIANDGVLLGFPLAD